MPIRVTTKPGAEGLIDIRVGGGHLIHQIKVNAAAVAAHRDANNQLKPGLPLKVDGTPITGVGQQAVCVVGPEAVRVEGVDVFVNAIYDKGLSRKRIEDNLGRVLTADELAAMPAHVMLF